MVSTLAAAAAVLLLNNAVLFSFNMTQCSQLAQTDVDQRTSKFTNVD